MTIKKIEKPREVTLRQADPNWRKPNENNAGFKPDLDKAIADLNPKDKNPDNFEHVILDTVTQAQLYIKDRTIPDPVMDTVIAEAYDSVSLDHYLVVFKVNKEEIDAYMNRIKQERQALALPNIVLDEIQTDQILLEYVLREKDKKVEDVQRLGGSIVYELTKRTGKNYKEKEISENDGSLCVFYLGKQKNKLSVNSITNILIEKMGIACRQADLVYC